MSNPVAPRLGVVWDVEFDPVIDHQQGGRRPALVISNDRFNGIPHGLCIVVPITSRLCGIPSHVELAPTESGLSKISVAMCEQVKSLSVLRLRKKRGTVPTEAVAHIQATVSRFIDLA